MSWSLYLYLGPVAIAAVVLFVFMVKSYKQLTTPSATSTKLEWFFLACLLGLGICTIYFNFFTSTQYYAYNDYGTDTLHQYVPYYLNLLKSVREGTLGAWNFEYGLGVSFMSYQSWTLDPFNVVLIPLGLIFGDAALSFILVFIQALKICLCGVLFHQILLRYCQYPISRILGSVFFAFCGYLIMWGQHYWLGSVVVMAILMTLLIERLLEKWSIGRFWALLLVTAVTVIMSTYSGYMVMLYAATYAILRTIYVKDCKGLGEFFKAFAPLAIPVICGLLISCITLVPYASQLLGETSRVNGSSDTSLTSTALGYLVDFVPLKWIPMLLSRLLGNSLLASTADLPQTLVPHSSSFTNTNVYEFVQMGFGCCALILLGQFIHWLYKDADAKAKVLGTIAVLLCLLYCCNYFLPALSDVFAGVQYRSAFALAPPICLGLTLGFEKRFIESAPSKPVFVVCAVITAAGLAWSLLNALNGRLESALYLVALIVVCICAGLHSKESLKPFAVTLLCACALGTLFLDGFMSVNNRVWITKEAFPAATENEAVSNTEEALAWLEENDSSLYRVEKLYRDWTRLSDSLAEGYMGVASYNSTLDDDVVEFYDQLWPGMFPDNNTLYSEYINDPDHPKLLKMLGVKYILSHDELGFDWCSLVHECGIVKIYQVNGAASIATVNVGSLAESDMQSLSAADKESMLADCTIVPDDIYAANSETAMDTADTAAGENIEVITGGSFGDTVYPSLDPVFTLSSDGSVTGSLTAITNGSVVCLAIPHTSGWKVSVDEQEVETYRANYGFIGFTVSAGEHTIEAHFEVPGLKIGLICAVIGVVLAIVACVFERRRRLSITQSDAKHLVRQ